MKSEDPRQLVLNIMGALSVAAVIGYIVLSAKLGVKFAVPVAIFGAVSSAIFLRGKLVQAIARLISGAPEPSDDTTGHMLAEMDELRGRVQELEERLDFSERLLAQQSRVPER